MDVMYTKDIDVMCFIFSDCDFTPMVTRALAEGKVVLGFGERKTRIIGVRVKFLRARAQRSITP